MRAAETDVGGGGDGSGRHAQAPTATGRIPDGMSFPPSSKTLTSRRLIDAPTRLAGLERASPAAALAGRYRD